MTLTLEEILAGGGSGMSRYCNRPLILTEVEDIASDFGPTLQLTFVVESGATETVNTGGRVLRKQAVLLKENGLLPAPVQVRERLSKKSGNTYYELAKQG